MREFAFTDTDFKVISERVYQACGIVLGPHKREMVYSRLARRIRTNELTSFAAYLDYLDTHSGAEFSHFINAITTNLTSFFRENHHFKHVSDTIIPALLESNKTSKRVRIWSAGCSTGEEPYSIAMTLVGRFPASWDVKILATDLDSNVLAKAQQGIYEPVTITGLSPAQLKRFFLKSTDGNAYRVKPQLQQMISFKRLNLLEKWPMKGPFDVIFCRNVLIYFDKKTKGNLFKGYHRMLAHDGHLFIGHSETMGKEHSEFKNLGKTMYKKMNSE
ncbi:CheR family methyltransferase [Pseudoalteromonas aurantia]|uniref:Chemotaxis protein methyltransferase n=2 Tax=Pseudoalteromonas TaxID=53246 RepID=A0A5S3V917_9GAMM|nr:protein-glutamate O-methyltransferase CheR [Pseudoalteromonas aurantia]TMO58751.1 chemotaxis protein CheR [Pseudoalteromonas aurantia]TMO68206.1 chemotaxis protein CheR [Pseudoalteromonas aurantia]TMO77088.1 chemotaxis protein CheR [Pseudoalteromonas aurantia]